MYGYVIAHCTLLSTFFIANCKYKPEAVEPFNNKNNSSIQIYMVNLTFLFGLGEIFGEWEIVLTCSKTYDISEGFLHKRNNLAVHMQFFAFSYNYWSLYPMNY
jgi:hypothetical protein